MENTRITYLYRDASNYKQYNGAVVAGTFTEQQIETIMTCLDGGEYFIPKQVGLPEKRFGEITEDDHCWFELNGDSFEITTADVDVDITASEIVKRFLEAKDNWDASEVFGTER